MSLTNNKQTGIHFLVWIIFSSCVCVFIYTCAYTCIHAYTAWSSFCGKKSELPPARIRNTQIQKTVLLRPAKRCVLPRLWQLLQVITHKLKQFLKFWVEFGLWDLHYRCRSESWKLFFNLFTYAIHGHTPLWHYKLYIKKLYIIAHFLSRPPLFSTLSNPTIPLLWDFFPVCQWSYCQLRILESGPN